MMHALKKPVICCGLTPCLQRILEFTDLKKGYVNRTSDISISTGGKGTNTARMVKQLGAASVLIQFSGGANGRLLEQKQANEGIDFKSVETQGETRFCQTLIEADNPEVTELVEEMPPVTPDEWDKMVVLFESMDFSNKIIPISGKLPAGAPIDGYAQICAIISKQGGQIILDTSGDPLLRTLEHKPFCVKMNHAELLQTVNTEDVVAGCHTLIKQGAQSVLITRGSQSAVFMDQNQAMEVCPPEINAVNPVGSGDAVTAGMAVSLSRNEDLAVVLANSIACGAANALNLLSGSLRLEDVERLRPSVKITQDI